MISQGSTIRRISSPRFIEVLPVLLPVMYSMRVVERKDFTSLSSSIYPDHVQILVTCLGPSAHSFEFQPVISQFHLRQ
jgi:hypothetical protein